jgi:hypothetical protein
LHRIRLLSPRKNPVLSIVPVLVMREHPLVARYFKEVAMAAAGARDLSTGDAEPLGHNRRSARRAGLGVPFPSLGAEEISTVDMDS